MNRDDIIRMALEAGFLRDNAGVYQPNRKKNDADCTPELARFSKLVAAAEREACAEIIERNVAACKEGSLARGLLESNAKAIRARGKE